MPGGGWDHEDWLPGLYDVDNISKYDFLNK